MPKKTNAMQAALFDDDNASINETTITTSSGSNTANKPLEKPTKSRKAPKHTKTTTTTTAIPTPTQPVDATVAIASTDAPAKDVKKATEKRSGRGTFACYIKRAAKNASRDGVIYRMDHGLVGVLDQLASTYIQAAARETQSALDLMHLKQCNLKALTFALTRITPKPIMSITLDKMKTLENLIAVASKSDAVTA